MANILTEMPTGVFIGGVARLLQVASGARFCNLPEWALRCRKGSRWGIRGSDTFPRGLRFLQVSTSYFAKSQPTFVSKVEAIGP